MRSLSLRNILAIHLVSLLSLISFQNCSPNHEGQASSDFASLNMGTLGNGSPNEKASLELIDQKCSSCHLPGHSSGVYDLTDLKNLVGTGLVVPGKSVNSLLFESIQANRMPPGAPLTTAEKKTLKDWIDQAGSGSGSGAGSNSSGLAFLKEKGFYIGPGNDSRLCLEASGTLVSGAKIVQATCGAYSLTFEPVFVGDLILIKVKDASLCAEIGSISAGGSVSLASCNENSLYQQFKPVEKQERVYAFGVEASGHCLDMNQSSNELITYDCTNNVNQTFYLVQP